MCRCEKCGAKVCEFCGRVECLTQANECDKQKMVRLEKSITELSQQVETLKQKQVLADLFGKQYVPIPAPYVPHLPWQPPYYPMPWEIVRCGDPTLVWTNPYANCAAGAAVNGMLLSQHKIGSF